MLIMGYIMGVAFFLRLHRISLDQFRGLSTPSVLAYMGKSQFYAENFCLSEPSMNALAQ